MKIIRSSKLALLLLCCFSARSSHGWLIPSNFSNENDKRRFQDRKILVSFILTCCLQFVPQISEAFDLECPQSFGTRTLGVQNIILHGPDEMNESRHTDRLNQRDFPNERILRSNHGYTCRRQSPEQAISVGQSINGLIYLPSSSFSRSRFQPLERADYSLVITVSTIENPSIILAGARVPMIEIEGFPISFSIGRNNVVIDDKHTLETQKDFYVTAKICPSSSRLPCKDAEALFQARGISKMLLLPFGEDEDLSIRAATSIRLSQESSPDILYSW